MSNVRALMKRSLLVSMMILCGNAFAVETLEGSWENRKNGLFFVELVQMEKMACRQVTEISGEKVDVSFVVGTIQGNILTVDFTSGFNENGSRGKAEIRRTHSGVSWHVTKPLKGESWIAGDINATSKPWEKDRKTYLAGWCANQWSLIESGNSSAVPLQP
jgi:hypothetical protein